MVRTGLFGGTFDPVHNGHVVVAVEMLERAGLDRLLLMPAARAPQKPEAPWLPAELRARLLELAINDIPGVEVSELEILRGGISYTVDTVRAIKSLHPADELCLVIGADALAGLHAWREVRALAELVTFLVAARAIDGDPDATDAPPPIPGIRVRHVATTPLGFSSSTIRDRIRAGRPIRGYVPCAVEAELAARGFLRTAGSGA